MKIFLWIVCLLAFAAPVHSQTPAPYIGQIALDSLFNAYPGFAANHYRYEPDSASVAWLKAFDGDAEIVVVLGTWCDDSKISVPQLIKTLEAADNSNLKSSYFGISEDKDKPADVIELYGIIMVPTFIVYSNNIEIGRIVEYPQKSVEKDLVAILAARPPKTD